MRERSPSPVDTGKSPHARLRTLPFGSVVFGEGFWSSWQTVNGEASLPHVYGKIEEAGVFDNFRLAAGERGFEYKGPCWQDSHVYKWLESAAYELAREPGAELRAKADGVIERVASAQADDGYLYTYHQAVKPDEHWAHIGLNHELYSAGHLIEAAVTFSRLLGDERLLRVARRYADHIGSVFGPDRRRAAPGHPEIELALVELYRATGEKAYLDLAQFFIDERGHGVSGEPVMIGPEYQQDHVGVREASMVVGHAVRQLYLTTGVTDLYLETGEPALLDAMMRQWRDMTGGKLYITGGAGARYVGESFSEPHELPNDRSYSETCAAVASILWNWRLLLATGDGRFADLIERTLYNGFLSGVSLDGLKYFYTNPLLSRRGTERKEWFECACCPPNVTRLIGSLTHYFATGDEAGLQIHQYASMTAELSAQSGCKAKVRMETLYPWEGLVRIEVGETDGSSWALQLRIPAWCQAPVLSVNGQPHEPQVAQGYAKLERPWHTGDVVELELPVTARFVEGHPRCDATRASVAIERGPLVYCLEGWDQEPGVDVADVEVAVAGALESKWCDGLLGGVVAVEAAGWSLDLSSWEGQLYRDAEAPGAMPRKPVRLTAIPYYAWANRGAHAMRVWIPRGKESRGGIDAKPRLRESNQNCEGADDARHDGE